MVEGRTAASQRRSVGGERRAALTGGARGGAWEEGHLPKTLVRVTALALAVAVAGCGDASGKPRTGAAGTETQPAACEVAAKGLILPERVKESSGIVESRRHLGIFWTHNDSGHHSTIFAVNAAGQELGETRVESGKNHDWEDIGAGPCGDGKPDCLYLADTGNNSRDVGKTDRLKGPKAPKPFVRIYVFPEPEPGAAQSAHAHEYRGTFPGDARPDVEALFVLPDGGVYLVTKGGDGPVELYRWPTPLKLHDAVPLQRVRQLEPRPRQVGDRVTGASASPDGRYVAIRTYAALAFYRTPELLAGGGPFAQVDLDPIAEPQGEAVYLANDGRVVLTSEGAGAHHLPATMAMLQCALER